MIPPLGGGVSAGIKKVDGNGGYVECNLGDRNLRAARSRVQTP